MGRNKAADGYKISKSLNIPQSTVKSIINELKEYVTAVNLPRAGCPQKLNDHAGDQRPMTTLNELQVTALFESIAKSKPL